MMTEGQKRKRPGWDYTTELEVDEAHTSVGKLVLVCFVKELHCEMENLVGETGRLHYLGCWEVVNVVVAEVAGNFEVEK